MKFFYFIFYKSCKLTFTKSKELFPENIGMALLSLFLAFNISTILYFIFKIEIEQFKLIAIIIILSIIIRLKFNNNKKINDLCNEWEKEEKSKKTLKTIGFISYILFTHLLFVLALIAQLSENDNKSNPNARKQKFVNFKYYNIDSTKDIIKQYGTKHNEYEIKIDTINKQ